MAIQKVVGTDYTLDPGTGRNVPARTMKFATSQPDRSGFKAQGSLVGNVGAVPGMGTPATHTMKNAPFQRPDKAPAAKNVIGRAVHDYSPKKRI